MGNIRRQQGELEGCSQILGLFFILHIYLLSFCSTLKVTSVPIVASIAIKLANFTIIVASITKLVASI